MAIRHCSPVIATTLCWLGPMVCACQPELAPITCSTVPIIALWDGGRGGPLCRLDGPLSRCSLAFPDAEVGDSLFSIEFVALHNVSCVEMHLEPGSLAGGAASAFAIESDWPEVIGPSSRIAITVGFHPLASGAATDELVIVSDAANAAAGETVVSLSGTGT